MTGHDTTQIDGEKPDCIAKISLLTACRIVLALKNGGTI